MSTNSTDSDPEVEIGNPPPVPKARLTRRRINIAAIIAVACLVVAGIAYGAYRISQNDDETADGVASSNVVEIPQVPSLKMLMEDGTLYVENDGNVTMSDIEVRDADGSALCEMAVISPGDREPCENAGDAADLTVVGSGPQGQPFEGVLE